MVKYDFYISGAMTGLPDLNQQHFNRVAKLLQDRGFTVFNPADIKGEADWGWKEFMRAAVRGQMECEDIFMLNGYENSKGAMIELDLAKSLGMGVTYEMDVFCKLMGTIHG